MKRKIKVGTTSHIEQIVLDDSSSATGAGLTGILFNTASLAAKYKRAGSSTWTTITLATATAGTWTSGGFIESSSGAGGEYEFHVPDAVIASGVANAVVVLYGATNMVPVRIEYELDAVDYQDATRFGLSALPNAAAGANGGLPTGDANARIDVGSWLGTAVTLSATTTKPEVDVASISDDAAAANNAELAFDGTGYGFTGCTIPTVTTNSDMRGTDSALLAASAPTNFGDLAITASSGKVTVGTNDDKTGYSISGTITTLDSVLTTAMSESYAADGATFTVAQALYEICQSVSEFAIADTTKTVRKRDGTTTAATYTLDDATSPTSITRAT